MDITEFIQLYKGYWPSARNVDAPLQRELWSDLIEDLPDEVIKPVVKHHARKARTPPTVLDLQGPLYAAMDDWAAHHPETGRGAHWLRIAAANQAAANDAPQPTARPCEGCGQDIRRDAAPPFRRYDCDGGLVFSQREGHWYAMLCPQCGGPADRRPAKHAPSVRLKLVKPGSLPLPDPAEWDAGYWVPLSRTPAAEAYDRLIASRDVTKLSLQDPDFATWRGFVHEAVANTRAVIEPKLVAELEARAQAERDRRVAAFADIRERRALADAALAAASAPQPVQGELAVTSAADSPETHVLDTDTKPPF